MEKFIGKLVKLTYEDGGEVRFLKGDLLSVESDFIEIRSLSNSYYIRKDQILRIKIANGGRD